MRILFLTFDYLTRPLGVATLAAALGAGGHSCEVAALRDQRRQLRLLQDFKPQILCLSLITGQHPLFLARARELKTASPELIVLAGGPHPTFYPECIDDSCLDAVCRGEGDLALPAMIEHVERHGRLPEALAGWWIRRPDGTVSQNPVAPLVENLDTLPFPDRDLFDRACPGFTASTVYVMASRGCPYDCSYCFNHAYRELYDGRGRMCRRRSVEHVIEELQILKKRYALQIVVFQDDTFNLDRQWLQRFADRYPREIGRPFHCHLRADLLDEEMAGLLIQAGCLSVKLGIEAGSESVRNGILNRHMTLGQFERACELLHRSGIHFATENILAVPGTTLDDDFCTYEVNRRVRPHHSFATLMQIYPGTRIAAYALEKGFLNRQPTDFPGTFYADSTVAIANKKERGRLRALFALGVSMRLPAGAMRLLIRLPLRRLYETVDRFWKGYCLRFRIYPYRQSPAAFVRELAQYLFNQYY